VELYLPSPNTPSWRGAPLKKTLGQLYVYNYDKYHVILAATRKRLWLGMLRKNENDYIRLFCVAFQRISYAFLNSWFWWFVHYFTRTVITFRCFTLLCSTYCWGDTECHWWTDSQLQFKLPDTR